jgi:energy-coupling factor transporter ATP-binding protein EcfA2
MYHYTAFGFNIASEIEFPQLFISENSKTIDVHIRIGTSPKMLPEGKTANPELWITPSKYLIHFKDVAWYYAENGNLIIVDSYPDADIKSLRLYLLCNAMAAIIHQRKLIPLHASGIINRNGVVLIAGQSGIGKSTTIKALTQKGHKIFSDDVCVLKSQRKKILAIPSYPMMKLWENTFELLQLGSTNEEHKLKYDMNKYGVFFHDEFISKWKPVMKIFNIEKIDDDGKVMITKLKGIESFKIIGENTYRNHYIEPMKLNTLHFKMVSGLVQQCEVYKISRPANKESINEVVEIIEKELL